MAHGAGGRLVAGAVRLQDSDDSVGHLRPGEVVEFKLAQLLAGAAAGRQARSAACGADHLRAVPVGRLMHDADSA